MRRILVGGIALVCAASITGCLALLPDREPAPIAEVEPSVSAIGAAGGWPTGVSPGFYMVSEQIAAYCPNGERYLSGTQILEVIPHDAFAKLDGYACAFMASPNGDPDTLDEAAYHVDEGLAELLAAYATTEGLWQEGDCDVDVESIAPTVRVEYQGVGYSLMPSMLACEHYPDVDAAVAALRVTEVAHETVSFAEYLEGDL